MSPTTDLPVRCLQVPIPVPLPFFSFTGESGANFLACWPRILLRNSLQFYVRLMLLADSSPCG